MQMEYQSEWEKCIAFHGHECGGLAVGFRAALYARELLCENYSEDEELVCITETDMCGVDAIQVMLGCTVGKGNLIFNWQGKNAFSFFNRKTGKSVRLVLRRTPDKTKDERLEWLMNGDYHEMFDCKETLDEIPEKARIFTSYICELCGESVAESHVRLQNGKKVCPRCHVPYTRGF